MPGLDFYTADQPYVGFSIHGALGRQVCFRYRYGRQECVPYYVPTNPRTPRQQAWRWVFRQAVLSWQSLTPGLQLVYDRVADIRGGMSGFNWYVSEYLQRYASNS